RYSPRGVPPAWGARLAAASPLDTQHPPPLLPRAVLQGKPTAASAIWRRESTCLPRALRGGIQRRIAATATAAAATAAAAAAAAAAEGQV
ncbi:hypothetical protein MMPV_007747, partial [Pyropia vietnamensis]